jgi:hypothetical protein
VLVSARSVPLGAAIFEFIDRLHQADIAFLDQVEELQAAMVYFLAIEMTRRRFASTISFLAWRASRSPFCTDQPPLSGPGGMLV